MLCIKENYTFSRMDLYLDQPTVTGRPSASNFGIPRPTGGARLPPVIGWSRCSPVENPTSCVGLEPVIISTIARDPLVVRPQLLRRCTSKKTACQRPYVGCASTQRNVEGVLWKTTPILQLNRSHKQHSAGGQAFSMIWLKVVNNGFSTIWAPIWLTHVHWLIMIDLLCLIQLT